jgi:hypothetical protein
MKSAVLFLRCCILHFTGLIECKQAERSTLDTDNIYVQAIRNNNSNSEYSSHTSRTRNTYGTDTVDVKRTQKGKRLDALEKYHIYKISRINLHMNDKYWYTGPNIQNITGNEHP